VVDKVEAFVRKIAAMGFVMPHFNLASLSEEARAIVAELPQPVDPDLLEARKIEYDICDEQGIDPEPALRGEWDDKPGVRGVLAAIKRGRALERGEP